MWLRGDKHGIFRRGFFFYNIDILESKTFSEINIWEADV